MDFGTNQLELWKFHVDWNDARELDVQRAPTAIPVAGFTAACNGSGGVCIPQPGTTQQLDSLGDRLMYRLAYRNFGDHESLVVNQSVTAGTTTGVRWYELRDPGAATPTVYQQGTYAPDATLPLDGQRRHGPRRRHRRSASARRARPSPRACATPGAWPAIRSA